jgi:P27 family predicted phage terminase small subunit
VKGGIPKSARTKKLAGNPGKKTVPKEPEVVPPADSGPPERLREAARAVWRRVVPQLKRWDKLSEVDAELLCGFCNLMARHYEAEAYVADHGMTYETSTGNVRERPEVKISKESLNGARQIGEQFGFSPQSRVRIGTVEEPEADDPLDSI